MKKVLVVYKRSFLEAHKRDRKVLGSLVPETRARFLRADIENRRTIADIHAWLEKSKIPFDSRWRGDMARGGKYALVITVGGDGTFFAASHYVENTPVLAINSDPGTSLSLFSCADRSNFQGKIDRAIAGDLPSTKLNRLELEINGRTVAMPVLNDILFAHRNPAAMSRYRLAVDGRREEQRGSGVWVSTAAGSTAGLHAAGGSMMAITSRRMQYRVREPYTWPHPPYRLLKGYARETISFTVLMTEAAAWLDGSRIRHELKMNDRILIRPHARPLTLLGYDDRRRKKLFGKGKR
jgi:NAD+ kinase